MVRQPIQKKTKFKLVEPRFKFTFRTGRVGLIRFGLFNGISNPYGLFNVKKLIHFQMFDYNHLVLQF